MNISLNKKLLGYGKRYFDVLTKEVIPFWLKNSRNLYGAINNCRSEDGTALSKDRYIWSQGRALWTISAIPKWHISVMIHLALVGFLKQHCVSAAIT